MTRCKVNNPPCEELKSALVAILLVLFSFFKNYLTGKRTFLVKSPILLQQLDNLTVQLKFNLQSFVTFMKGGKSLMSIKTELSKHLLSHTLNHMFWKCQVYFSIHYCKHCKILYWILLYGCLLNRGAVICFFQFQILGNASVSRNLKMIWDVQPFFQSPFLESIFWGTSKPLRFLLVLETNHNSSTLKSIQKKQGVIILPTQTMH